MYPNKKLKRHQNYGTEVAQTENIHKDTLKNFHDGMQFFIQNCIFSEHL